MKLLTRIGCGLGRSGGLISFINRERSPVPRFQQTLRSSIHVLPIPPSRRRHSMVTTVTRSRRKERETSGQPPAPPPAPAADGTRWTLLVRWCCATNSTAVDVVANIDAKTVAETHTSRGGQLRVSLSRAAAPGVSFLCFDDWAGRHGTRNNDDDGFTHAVVAGHGDSVLLGFGGDYFVYKLAAGQPPSLSLLPACHDPMYEWDPERGELCDFDCDPGEVCRTERALYYMDTGLLRCGGGGGGEFLVAQLQLAYRAPFDAAELCVLRLGSRDWEFRAAVPIVHHDGGGRHDLGRWQALNAAVPAGKRFLCWVSYCHSTLLVCDMMAAEENTKLRYVPLPVKAVPPPSKENEWDDDDDDYEDQLPWLYYRTIGAVPPQGTDAAAAVRFVSIDRRCCCGAPVTRSACDHSDDAFTVTTWTLALPTTTATATGEDEDEPMTWVKEGVLDCEEFWALLAGYTNEDLPRRAWPESPVVSSEKTDVVCFLVAECEVQRDGKIWMLEVDMRRKTLISVVPCPPHPVPCVNYGNPLSVKLHS